MKKSYLIQIGSLFIYVLLSACSHTPKPDFYELKVKAYIPDIHRIDTLTVKTFHQTSYKENDKVNVCLILWKDSALRDFGTDWEVLKLPQDTVSGQKIVIKTYNGVVLTNAPWSHPGYL